MGFRTRAIACSVVLAAIALVAVPGGRSFASDVASKIVHLRPGRASGPIPFILDLHKHKRTRKAPAPSRQPQRPPGLHARSTPQAPSTSR